MIKDVETDYVRLIADHRYTVHQHGYRPSSTPRNSRNLRTPSPTARETRGLTPRRIRWALKVSFVPCSRRRPSWYALVTLLLAAPWVGPNPVSRNILVQLKSSIALSNRRVGNLLLHPLRVLLSRPRSIFTKRSQVFKQDGVSQDRIPVANCYRKTGDGSTEQRPTPGSAIVPLPTDTPVPRS